MNLIDPPTAKAHLREEENCPDEQIEPYLLAAERSAAQFLNRKVYASQSALNTAIAGVPAFLAAASAARMAALEAAGEIEDVVEQAEARAYAEGVYQQAIAESREVRYGIVVTDDIKAGMLLILGHLYENRQDVQSGVSAVAIPMGSRHLLQPYRIGLGV